MPEEKNSLISDIAGLSKPMTKFIDVVSNGMNILTTPWQTKRNAKADAEAIETLSHALDNVPGEITYSNPNFSITVKKDTFEETAIERIIQQEIDRQLNLTEIISKTASLIEEKESVSEEPIEKDWLTKYSNIAQDISDEDMQNLWAQILSTEIETPHSFSYRALDFLKNIRPYEAKIIRTVMQNAVECDGFTIILGGKDFLKKINIPFIHSLLLEELGLATGGLSYTLAKNKETYMRICHTNKFLRVTTPETQDVMVEAVKFTSLGQEIFKLIDPHYDYNNLELCIKHLNKPSLKYELIDNVIILDDAIQWEDYDVSIIGNGS